ncbi:MAG: serine/threonine-protein kinase, partial [Polyangiales bacterium]
MSARSLHVDHGDVVDGYRLVAHVATGGMGAVWRGERDVDGRRQIAAIKTILPALASDERTRAMFLEEARIASRLAHRNVARVQSVGDEAGALFIAFEWVDGASLEAICRAAEIDGRRIPIAALLTIVADACAGLHALHQLTDDDGRALGAVHRDVTPSNILVDRDGVAKLIDFGIAKSRDRMIAETRSGLVKGTPQYMSPEAACRGALVF